MNRTLGILALAVVTAAAGGVAFACDHDGCAGKSADGQGSQADGQGKQADCKGIHADCKGMHADSDAKHADCAGKSADCAAKMESAASDGHECGMTAEQCSEHMKQDAQTHGWLGVSLDMDAEGQMSISKIWTGSPAEKAGFHLGDKVVAMNGVEVNEKNGEKIFSLMRDAKIGDRMKFAVARGADKMTLDATLGKMPDDVIAESIEKHIQEHHKIAKN
jgi:C-terminal processing protease CtpA/Prc